MLGSGSLGAVSAAEAAIGPVDTGVPVLQSQFHVHVQLQSQACFCVSVQTCPSAFFHVHVHVNHPVEVVVGAVAAGALVDCCVHAQFHVEPPVGAAVAAVAPVGGVPSPVQVQFHAHCVPGAAFAVPGSTIETFWFFAPVTETFAVPVVVPVAVAPFVCVTVPSVPGLPTRIDTFTFFASRCVASAYPTPEDAAGVVPASPTVTTFGPFPSCVWISCWETTPWFVTSVSVLVALVSWSV